MSNAEEKNGGGAADEALRDYCIRVVRFLSDSALDPHLYFEKKLTGDVRVAESTEQLLGILIGLIEWIDEIYSEAPGLSGIDRALSREGLPTLSLLRSPETRPAGLVLACGRIRTRDEYRRVEDLVRNASASASDRETAGRLLAGHERA